jgi:hypothetical protein
MADPEKDTKDPSQRAEDKDPNLTPDDKKDDKGDGKTGGPSDEWKMKRLEQENADKERKLQELQKQMDEANLRSMDPEERIKAREEKLYSKQAETDIKEAIKDDLSKLPEPIRKHIESDPLRFIDRETLQLEFIKVNTDDPEQKYAAITRAALRSLPTLVKEMTGKEEGDKNDDGTKVSHNPPKTEGDSQKSPDKQSLWTMPMDQLRDLKGKMNK